MSYTVKSLVLSSHPDSSKTTGEWVGSHSYGEDSYPITNTTYIAPTSGTGLYTLWYGNATIPTNGSYSAEHHIEYSNGTWSDGESTFAPNQITNTDVWVNQTSCSDAEYIYIWSSSTQCRGRFLSPYYSSTGTEGVNVPFVTWYFPNRSCGSSTYVGVTHTAATSSATTYTVHDESGQIGTITVGTGATATANFSFTISARTLTVKDASGSELSNRVFDCSGLKRKVHSNFW